MSDELLPRQSARLRIFARYLAALEHGDDESLAQALREAENDPTLERLIMALHTGSAEMDGAALSQAEKDQAQAVVFAMLNSADQRTTPAIGQAVATASNELPETNGAHPRISSAATPVQAYNSPEATLAQDNFFIQENDEMNEVETTRGSDAHIGEYESSSRRPDGSIGSVPNRHGAPPVLPQQSSRRPNRWLRLGQTLVAALVMAALVGGFFTVLRHLNSGIARPTVPSFGTTLYSPVGAHVVIAGSWIGEVWALDPATGKAYWKFTTGDGQPVTAVFIQNGVVLVGDAYGSPIKVFAVRLKDGMLLWKHAIGAENGFPNYLFANQDAVFVADASGTYAFRVRDGKQLWRIGNTQILWAAKGVALLVGNAGQINGYNQSLLAIRDTDGKQLWSHSFGDNEPEVLQVLGQTVYAGIQSAGGIQQPLVLLNLATGRVLATESPLPDNFMPLSVTNTRVIGSVPEIIGSTFSATFYSYSLPSLKRQWRAPNPYLASYGAVTAQQDTLFVSYQTQQNSGITPGENTSGVTLHPTYRPAVASLDLATGHTRWNWIGPVVPYPIGNSPTGVSFGNDFALLNIVSAQGKVFSATDGGIFALDSATGKQLWRFNPSDTFVTLAAV